MSSDFAPHRSDEPGKAERAHGTVAFTRRSFLGSVRAGMCASLGSSLFSHAMFAPPVPAAPGKTHPWLYAAVRGQQSQDSIHSLVPTSKAPAHAIVTQCPGVAALAMHPYLPVLYAVSDVLPGQSLPHGHLQAFSLDEHTGRLRSMARVNLSLSATGPRSLAVSPDGASLLVAASTGGLWNAFHLDSTGMPSAVAVARKELGTRSGNPAQASAHPHSVLYLSAGRHSGLPGQISRKRIAVASDTGSGQFSILQVEQDRIAVHARYSPNAGGRPSHMALAADGEHLLVADAGTPSLALWRLQSSHECAGLQRIAEQPLGTPLTALLAHPDQPVAFSVRPMGAGSHVELWRVGGRSLLQSQTLTTLPCSVATSLAYSQDALWVATAQGLLRLTLKDNRLESARLLYPIDGLIALAG